MSLFDTGIRPLIDDYLTKESEKVRDYGDYWSASSAGYCMRKLIFERLGVPYVNKDDRKQRVFSAGHIFHEWMQNITKQAGISLAQELELLDNDLMIKGHIDDLVLVNDKLVLYDFKTAHSKWFEYKRTDPIGHYHKMQLGTYMYMLRAWGVEGLTKGSALSRDLLKDLTEGRILSISKDDLRMAEQQLLWTPALEKQIVEYWTTLNGYWKSKKLPACTCAKFDGGFMSKEKWNPYYFQKTPCSLAWYEEWKAKNEAG